MKLKKIRNALLVVLALALVSATTVAITWATVTGKNLSNQKENNFTNNPEIGLEFQEPTFDTITWGNERPGGDNEGVPTGDIPAANQPVLPNGDSITDGSELGYNMAQKYTPEMRIPKNPQLRNSTGKKNDGTFESVFATENMAQNGATSDEWVAMAVEYTLTIPETGVYVANSGSGTQADPFVGAVPAFANHTIRFDDYTQFATAIAVVGYIPKDATGDARKIENATSLNHRTDTSEYGWTDISDIGKTGTLFMYNTKLSSMVDYNADTSNPKVRQNETQTLFDFVAINNVGTKWVSTPDIGKVELYELEITGKDTDNSNAALTNQKIYVTALPKFEIHLTGYAIQGDEIATVSAATPIMKGFIASK